jgi:hypothetical protein
MPPLTRNAVAIAVDFRRGKTPQAAGCPRSLADIRTHARLVKSGPAAVPVCSAAHSLSRQERDNQARDQAARAATLGGLWPGEAHHMQVAPSPALNGSVAHGEMASGGV